MPTASTKRRSPKQARAKDNKANAAARQRTEGATQPETQAAPEVPESVWRAASTALLLVAAFLRLVALELNPLHHDEGVNGWFLTRLVREGVYQYDPSNYHGPTLYYFALVPAWLLEKTGIGMSTFAIRMIPALFGVATVWLVLSLRRYVGTIGALTAAALIAVSPGAVYQSRYFIHETLFVFFTLGIVVASLRYYETGGAHYLLLAFVSAALLFATKETAFISVGVLGLAWSVALLWTSASRALRRSRDEATTSRDLWRTQRTGGGGAATWETTGGAGGFGDPKNVALLLLAGIALFVVVNILFYSSFFTYAKGVEGALSTFKIWARTGNEAHTKPFDTYLNWLQQEESPVYVLAVLGALWAALDGRNRFAVFTGAWGTGMLLAYSLVHYKTPWLSLNFVVPLAIAGGYAVQQMYEWAGRRTPLRALALSCAALALAVSSYQMVVLNFYHYDDDTYPYVYAHTRREFLDLVREIERLSKRAGTGRQTHIAIASPDYWPMPWYFRDYKGVGFQGRVDAFTEPIVVGNQTQDAQLQAAIGATHRRVGGVYALRPGVELVLYARRNLVQP